MISNFDIVTYFAVRGGFEPPRWDSVRDNIAGLWSTHIQLPISCSAPSRREGVSAVRIRISPPNSFRIT